MADQSFQSIPHLRNSDTRVAREGILSRRKAGGLQKSDRHAFRTQGREFYCKCRKGFDLCRSQVFCALFAP
jgi:hypothetical protein